MDDRLRLTQTTKASKLKQEMKKEFQSEIKSSFSHSFEIEEDGLFTINIKASCKPGWRNKWWLKLKGIIEDILDSHLDDEDLRVEIDGIVFNKPKGKRGLFNSPAAFSGTKTLGKTKTVMFLASLTKGAHAIKFIPDGSPHLERIEIEKVADPQKTISYLNLQAENENYYSWYTFALVNQPLITLSISARAGGLAGEKDDDDLKILIDGELQKNSKNRHQDSYFCGSTLKGKEDTFVKNLNFPKDIHYIELWADKKPILRSVEFDLAEASKEPIRIQKYKDERFGRDYNQLNQYIFDVVSFWNKFFLNQEYPPPSPLDPNLVKAIIYRESRLGYYPNENIIDVLQVWNEEDPAKPALLGEKPESEFVSRDEIAFIHRTYPKGKALPKVESREESIFWGVRWLYHKAQYLPSLEKPYIRKWLSWKEAAWNYNANPEIVKKYVEEVFSVYEKGFDLEGNVLWEE